MAPAAVAISTSQRNRCSECSGLTIPTNKELISECLAGEQSDTLCLLQHNDRKSRHRRIKKLRRYVRLAATSQLSLQ